MDLSSVSKGRYTLNKQPTEPSTVAEKSQNNRAENMERQ